MKSNDGICKQNIFDDELDRMCDELDGKTPVPIPKQEDTWDNQNPVKDNVVPIKRPPVKGVDFNHLDFYNPYRDLSRIDLHEEKRNWRWIETNVLKELMKSKLSGSEWSIFFSILHRTRGYCNKKSGFHNLIRDIPMTDIVSDTGMSRTTFYRTIESLMKKRIIYEVTEQRTGKTKIGINFRYDTWNIES